MGTRGVGLVVTPHSHVPFWSFLLPNVAHAANLLTGGGTRGAGVGAT